MGNVLQAGEGQAPTRQALLGAGTDTLLYISVCLQFRLQYVPNQKATD